MHLRSTMSRTRTARIVLGAAALVVTTAAGGATGALAADPSPTPDGHPWSGRIVGVASTDDHDWWSTADGNPWHDGHPRSNAVDDTPWGP